MIRADRLKAELFGDVGMRNSTITGYDIVDEDNQQSNSGLYFQDASDLVSVKNIKDAQEDPDITDEAFNELIKRMQESCIVDVCYKLISDQKDLVSALNVYPLEKSFEGVIAPRGKFVGFQIKPNMVGISGKVTWIELSFDGDVSMKLYLFNSNRPSDPIEIPVDIVGGQSMIIDADLFITDDLKYKGGEFYLGYFEDDLGSVRAYSRSYGNSNVRYQSDYFYIEPVSLDHTNGKIDIRSLCFESDSFGLNLGMSLYNDYTEKLIENKNMLWRLIQLQMHERVLSLIRYSTRSNITERLMASASLDLFGDKETGIKGVGDKLSDSIKTVKNALFPSYRITKTTISL